MPLVKSHSSVVYRHQDCMKSRAKESYPEPIRGGKPHEPNVKECWECPFGAPKNSLGVPKSCGSEKRISNRKFSSSHNSRREVQILPFLVSSQLARYTNGLICLAPIVDFAILCRLQKFGQLCLEWFCG